MIGTLTTAILVFGRVGTLITVLPVFSMMGMPRWVSALLALAASLLIALSIPPAEIDPAILPVLLAMGGEVLAGALMGLGVAGTFAALAFGGELVSLQVGMSFATLLDPLTRAQESAVSVFSSWLAGLVFVLLGLPGRCLEIVAASFDAVPPGGHGLAIADPRWALAAVVDCTALGVQLGGPVLAMVFLVHIFVALLSKLAPRMQAFFAVGITVTGIVGMGMLAVSLPWLVAVHSGRMVDAVDALARSVGR